MIFGIVACLMGIIKNDFLMNIDIFGLVEYRRRGVLVSLTETKRGTKTLFLVGSIGGENRRLLNDVLFWFDDPCGVLFNYRDLSNRDRPKPLAIRGVILFGSAAINDSRQPDVTQKVTDSELRIFKRFCDKRAIPFIIINEYGRGGADRLKSWLKRLP